MVKAAIEKNKAPEKQLESQPPDAPVHDEQEDAESEELIEVDEEASSTIELLAICFSPFLFLTPAFPIQTLTGADLSVHTGHWPQRLQWSGEF